MTTLWQRTPHVKAPEGSITEHCAQQTFTLHNDPSDPYETLSSLCDTKLTPSSVQPSTSHLPASVHGCTTKCTDSSAMQPFERGSVLRNPQPARRARGGRARLDAAPHLGSGACGSPRRSPAAALPPLAKSVRRHGEARGPAGRLSSPSFHLSSLSLSPGRYATLPVVQQP